SEYYNETWAPKSPYTSAAVKQFLANQVEKAKTSLPLKQSGNYAGYFALAKSGVEEPMSTHSDHYNTNLAYGNAAYSKGAVFLAQLGYIISD
ncbi:hypothetical protein ABTH20_19595, partial [Acinetobacter baumannii]